MSEREKDERLLDAVLKAIDDGAPSRRAERFPYGNGNGVKGLYGAPAKNDSAYWVSAEQAFREMRERLNERPSLTLSKKQRDWLTQAAEQLEVDLDEPIDNSNVPRGKHVPLFNEGRSLPLKPPGRR